MFDTGYRMLGAGAWERSREMIWEVGGGLRIENSCTPVADSCQCKKKRKNMWTYVTTVITVLILKR